jgi:hypothetical protein
MAIGFLAISLMEAIKNIKKPPIHIMLGKPECSWVLFTGWTLHFDLGVREMDYCRIGPERHQQRKQLLGSSG